MFPGHVDGPMARRDYFVAAIDENTVPRRVPTADVEADDGSPKARPRNIVMAHRLDLGKAPSAFAVDALPRCSFNKKKESGARSSTRNLGS